VSPGVTPGPAVPWWEEAVFYQIYPRSFCDTDGDGVGDLEGIRRHLDHLAWLGVDTLWLSPIYPSPMADFGYDVADYCGVDPLFGTLAGAEHLIDEAHTRGLRVLLDWVPNHTSSAHPWFVDSRSSRASRHRDWYIWRDDRPDSAGGSGPPGSPGRLPNNWRSAFPGVGGGNNLPPAWTWDEATGQWYLHLFLPVQPDLDWTNPEVRAAMVATLRFWFDRGVDGFRVDVAHGLGKDPALADLPPELASVPLSGINDRAETHPILAELRAAVDAYGGDRMMVGEVYLPTTAQVATYYGTPERPELHLSFNFPPLFAPWDAAEWQRRIDEVVSSIDPVGGWPTWVLSNHDNPRHRSRYGSEARARAAAVLLLTLRGTPFLYAGEELGLADADVEPGRRVDPGGRDGCRAPLPWDASPGHGWAPAGGGAAGGGAAGGGAAGGDRAAEPWLPWPPEASDGRTAGELRVDPSSILHLYRRLLAARRGSPALRHGSWSPLAAPDGMLAYLRTDGDDRRAVAVNFTGAALALPSPLADGAWSVEVTSAGEAVDAHGGGLAGDSAVILVPRQS
jgi:alpha-glucosidase